MNLLRQDGKPGALKYDVAIVGCGPAGVSAAIRAKQLAIRHGRAVSVCVIEKATQVGASTLPGAIMDPRAMVELFPDWRDMASSFATPVTEDRFLILSRTKAYRMPKRLVSSCFQNSSSYLISASDMVCLLGKQAQKLGVDIYAGYLANNVHYRDDGAVSGIVAADIGNAAGSDQDRTSGSVKVYATYTLVAEGAGGDIGSLLKERFDLNTGANGQTYATGLQELWEVPSSVHQPGLVIQSTGWPLHKGRQGVCLLYHLANRRVAVECLVDLCVHDSSPPCDALRRYQDHPEIRRMFANGRRICSGTRIVTSGGLQALPKLAFPGGALLGCAAGMSNASRLNSIHTAMKSGILAGEAVFAGLWDGGRRRELTAYARAFEQSWLYSELYKARNFTPLTGKGLAGALLFGLDQFLFERRR